MKKAKKALAARADLGHSVAEVLALAQRKLAKRGVWMQGTDAHEHRIDEGRLCVSLAVHASAATVMLGMETLAALRRSIGCPIVAEWNDEPGRTLMDVRAAIDKAIAAAKHPRSRPQAPLSRKRAAHQEGKGK